MNAAQALSPCTVIGQRYVILAAECGEGSCLHYSAQEIDTKKAVTIAEYFPEGLAARAPDGFVAATDKGAAELYDQGHKRFVSRAQRLSCLETPGLAPSYGSIEERNTSYAITEAIDGPTLDAWVRELGRSPTQREMDALLDPLLDAVAELHGAGILHLAITPDAIVLRDGLEPVLTRLWAAALLPGTDLPSASVHSAYLAPEMFALTAVPIGPRADVYGLAATIHLLLTGMPPATSAATTRETWMPPAIAVATGGYRPEFLQAVATSLAPQPSYRPPTVAALKSLLLEGPGSEASTDAEMGPLAQVAESPRKGRNQVSTSKSNALAGQLHSRVPWLPILTLGAVILAGLSYLGLRPALPPPGKTPFAATETTNGAPAPNAPEARKPRSNTVERHLSVARARKQLLGQGRYIRP